MAKKIHNPCMLNVLDRFFTNDLTLAESHYLTWSAKINPRIHVSVYQDDPYYLTIFKVDDKPVLKEVMVSGNLDDYVQTTTTNANLHSFLIEYAV